MKNHKNYEFSVDRKKVFLKILFLLYEIHSKSSPLNLQKSTSLKSVLSNRFSFYLLKHESIYLPKNNQANTQQIYNNNFSKGNSYQNKTSLSKK